MTDPITLEALMPRIQGKKLVPILVEPRFQCFSVSTPLPVFTSYCSGCTHLRGQGHCTAFPQGIPLEIALGIANHRHPFEGDNGIHFESNGEHVLLPLHEEMTSTHLEHIHRNLNTIEAGKSSMPIDIPAVFGQINRDDTMDQETECAELDRLKITRFSYIRYMQRLKGLAKSEIEAENQELKRTHPKVFARMMEEE